MRIVPRGAYKRARQATGSTAWMICPICGCRMSLGTRHTIASDGAVSPSVVCPREGCSFHDFIQLEGWAEK